MAPRGDLEERLAYPFRDQKILTRALTHASFLHEAKAKESGEDNERLEFLGDAVLDLVVSEELIRRYPFASEGELSKMKSRIVSGTALARVGREIRLGEEFLLGRGEERTGGREKSSLLADAMEAVIAAVYLDGGLSAAREVVLHLFAAEMKEMEKPETGGDYKTELQELCQKGYEVLPVYSVVAESGPDHQKVFEVEIRISDRLFGAGAGRSKKEAEQKAAKEVLERLRREPP